jgi:cobalt-zinc-cadmium efflux system membrane fusion protein
MNKQLVLITFIFICSCSSKTEVRPATIESENTSTEITLTDAQIKNAGIETGKPQMRSIHSILKVNGLIDVPPQNMVTISFPSGGYIKSTKLLPGMHIRKGQVLAVMQDPSIIQLQEDYLMAQSKFVLLQKEFDRQKLLNITKATSDKVFEQTSNDFQIIKISLSALKEKLLMIGIQPAGLSVNSISRSVNIYCPITGFVSAVRVNIGKYVNPTDVLFDLVNTNDLHLALTVFEKDIPSIYPGQTVRTYLTGDTSKIYEAKVMLVSKTLDSNRSALVHCHFIGAEPKLLPGMFMNADIEIKSSSVISVPEEAVVRSGDKDYIFIEHKNKQFALTPVSTIISENGYIAINSGNIDLLNQVIITKNSYSALMKMKNTGDAE